MNCGQNEMKYINSDIIYSKKLKFMRTGSKMDIKIWHTEKEMFLSPVICHFI